MTALNLDLFWLLQIPMIFQSVFVVAKLGIADLLKKQPRTAGELASELNVNEANLYRVLRGLASVGFLYRDKSNRFHLSKKLESLCTDAPVCLRYWIILMREIAWPAADKLLESVETGGFAFELSHGQGCWSLLETDDKLRELFDLGMGNWTLIHAPAIVAACDLSQTSELVDVGGGRGTLMVELLKANPHLKGTVFDRPEAEPLGRKYIADAGLADRCEMVGGDFLTKVPASQAYIIKHALHDWTDTFALRVLKTIRAAIKPGGRLLIVDAVMDGPPEHQAVVSMLDLAQMITTTGQVRTSQEIQTLVKDAGFELQTITPSRLGDVSILECKPTSSWVAESKAKSFPQFHPSSQPGSLPASDYPMGDVTH